MASEDFYHDLEDLSRQDSFTKVARITPKGAKVQKPLEYVTRLVVLLKNNFDPAFDVEEYIDNGIISLAENPRVIEKIKATFTSTFDLLYASAGQDALRRYEAKSGGFVGKVGQVALEAVAIGIARNLRSILQKSDPEKFVLRRIKEFWSQRQVSEFSKAGVSGGKRLQQTLPFGEDFFKP